MALQQIPTSVPSEEVTKDVRDTSNMEKIQDSNNQSQDIVEFNKNQKLAKEEADKIVEGLPKTIDQLSVEQQKQFTEFITPLLMNVDGIVDLLPNRLPETWEEELKYYMDVESNKSKLSPDEQRKLERAKKEAISKLTEDTTDAIDTDK